MLNYLVLNNKKIVNRPGLSDNNEYQYDLLTKVFDNVNLNPMDILVVNEHYVARPDLISLAVYGDDKYADVICKYNGISNPFEMNENDIIYLPDMSALSFMIDEDQIKASEYIEDSSSSVVSKEYQFQKYKNETRSPAEQVVGDNNYVIDKSMGVVFY